MNKHKLFVFAVVVLSLVFGALHYPGTASALPPSQNVTFRYERVRTIQPGKMWSDREGLHIRGRVDVGVVSGDLQGSAQVVYNADLRFYASSEAIRPVPPDGAAYGTVDIFTAPEELPVPAWTGNWSHQINSGRVTAGEMTAFSQNGKWVMQIDTVTEEEDRALTHTGTIYYNCTDTAEMPCGANLLPK